MLLRLFKLILNHLSRKNKNTNWTFRTFSNVFKNVMTRKENFNVKYGTGIKH